MAAVAEEEMDLDDEMMRVLRAWLEKDVEPVVLELEHGDIYPTELVEQMKEFGLFGANDQNTRSG